MKKIQACFQPCFLFLLILICFFLSLGQIDDQDTWFHLKTGEWIIKNLEIPHEQIFSYSIGGASWVDHSWLFQVLLFSIFKLLGGINALIFFKAVLVSLIIWITLKGFLNKSDTIFFLLASWLFQALFLGRAPVRPELISALFLSSYLYILFNKKDFRWLLLIQCIWINIHGYSILGPVLLFLFILSEFVKHKIKLPFKWNETKYFNTRAEYNRSLAILAVAILLFLLSPYGIANINYPFFALKNFLQGMNNFYHVDELSPLKLSDILFTQKHILLTSAVIFYLFSLLLNIQGVSIFNLLVYSCFFFMYCSANRNGIFFAIASCFCILDNFKAENLRHMRRYLDFRYYGILSISLAAFLGIYILSQQFFKFKDMNKSYIYDENFSSKSYLLGIDAQRFPAKAVDFILKNKINGPIFNSFDISGYLVFTLYPYYKVFIDGRIGLYDKRFVDEFMYSTADFEKWKELDKKYRFNMVVLDYGSIDTYYYLVKMLYKSGEWKLVYFNEDAAIFVKNNFINKEIILSNEVSLENISDGACGIPVFNDRNRSPYPAFFINRARFFVKAMDMPEAALKDLKKSELINSECYDVHQLTGYVYFQMKRFKDSEEAFMKSLKINPGIAEPYVNLGSTAAEMGLYKKAYLFYRQALRLDKNNEIARENLSRLIGQNLK